MCELTLPLTLECSCTLVFVSLYPVWLHETEGETEGRSFGWESKSCSFWFRSRKPCLTALIVMMNFLQPE